MTHDHLGTAVTATVTVVGGGITAAWVWTLKATPDTATELGVMGEAVKAAPSFVATLLVIYIVMVFLKHLRARDSDREKREAAFDALLILQRKETTDAMAAMTTRNAAVLEKIADNLDQLSKEQARIIEAVHGCRAGERR